jgi:hypothetical protein
MADGVTHVEIDAAEDRLDLVRRLRINSTPTVLVLGPGRCHRQARVGLPRKADVIAALGTAVQPGIWAGRTEVTARRDFCPNRHLVRDSPGRRRC